MTSKDIFNDAFPQDKQIGGSHYKKMKIQPYEFIAKNDLSFFALMKNIFLQPLVQLKF